MPKGPCARCGEGDGCMCGWRAGKPDRYRNRAKRTVYSGVAYPSKAEAEHALTLDKELRCGLILGWTRQVNFPLVPKAAESKGIAYRVDFLVFTAAGVCHVEEVKGPETDKFQVIKELWRERGLCDMIVLKKRGTTWHREVIPGKQGE